jgi:hypothetical protein
LPLVSTKTEFTRPGSSIQAVKPPGHETGVNTKRIVQKPAALMFPKPLGGRLKPDPPVTRNVDPPTGFGCSVGLEVVVATSPMGAASRRKLLVFGSIHDCSPTDSEEL